MVFVPIILDQNLIEFDSFNVWSTTLVVRIQETLEGGWTVLNEYSIAPNTNEHGGNEKRKKELFMKRLHVSSRPGHS